MTKPKFTPDPAPNIDGLPVEDQIRMLLNHLQRQFDRAEDWWPKDYEARIQMLESLSPFEIGTWPIVGKSSVSFDPIASQVYESKGYIYVQNGSQAKGTVTDYLSFDTATISVTGLGILFIALFDNGVGQATSFRAVSIDEPFYFSTDGLAWTSSNPSGLYSPKGILWYNDRWIAIGSNPSAAGSPTYGMACASTSDGTSWTNLHSVTDRSMDPNGSASSIASDGSVIMFTGNDHTAGTSYIIGYSDDGGASFTTYLAPDQVESGNGVWYEGGAWFYASSKRRLYRSTTGLSGSWTKVLDRGTLGGSFVQVKYANGVWLLLEKDNNPSASDYILRSTDGISWTTIQVVPASGGNNLDYDPVYGWMYANEYTGLYSTDDGLTWSQTNLGSPLWNLTSAFMRMNVLIT